MAWSQLLREREPRNPFPSDRIESAAEQDPGGCGEVGEVPGGMSWRFHHL